jgi:hypothetical protein
MSTARSPPRAAASRLTVASYVAESALAARRPPEPADGHDRRALLVDLMGVHRQLRGAANNLNQAVAKLHALGREPRRAGRDRRLRAPGGHRGGRAGGRDRRRTEAAAVMPNITKGTRLRGLLEYLWGPGKAEEHTNPRIVAGYDDPDPDLLAPPRHGDRWDDAADLRRQLDQATGSGSGTG